MLSEQHFDLLKRLSGGLMWDKLSDAEQEILRYFDREGLCTPRCDIKEGLWQLLPKGQAVLAAEEDIRRQRAEQARKDDAHEKQRVKERKQDRRDKWLIALASACFGYVVRLCIEHFDVVLVALRKLFHE